MDVEIEGGAVKFGKFSRPDAYGIGIRQLDSNSSNHGCGSIETTEVSVAALFAFNFFEGSESTNPQQQSITGVAYEYL